jgi:hypothetical protein
VRILIFVVLTAAIAGCGSASGGARTPTAPTPAASSSPTPTPTSAAASQGAESHLASACSSRARRILSRSGSSKPAPFTAPNGAESCHFEAVGGGPDVIVELDSAPQAYVRMDREQVEYWQNVEWSHQPARAAPYPMTSLGLGGYWFPLQRRLLTTDGVRLITIKVRSVGSSGPAAPKALAAGLARVYLGPLVKPPGY